MNINKVNKVNNLAAYVGEYVIVRTPNSRRVMTGELLEIDGFYKVKLGVLYFEVIPEYSVELVEV